MKAEQNLEAAMELVVATGDEEPLADLARDAIALLREAHSCSQHFDANFRLMMMETYIKLGRFLDGKTDSFTEREHERHMEQNIPEKEDGA